MVDIQPATADHLQEVHAWLKAERDQTGEGFYCNWNIIEQSFRDGEGLCAVDDGRIVGFAVFQMFTDGGDAQIVEVRPSSRGFGIGSLLLKAVVEVLRRLGAKYVDAECTSQGGEALCRRHGFEDYIDPRNARREWDNPTLRLYLSEWRPPSRQLWA